MRLKECYIKGYGNLIDKHIEFSNLNEFIKHNGYGKSTLTSFIIAMLYGLDSVKANTKDFLDRKHYLPFKTTFFGGSLTLVDVLDTYVIERTFSSASSKDDTVKVYKNNVITNIINPGIELFHLDKESFIRLAIISSNDIDIKTTTNINKELSNITFDTNSVEDSIKLLQDKRKNYSTKGKTSILANELSKKDALLLDINNIDNINNNLELKYNRLNYIDSNLVKYNSVLSDINILDNIKVYDDNLSAINEKVLVDKANFSAIPDISLVDEMIELDHKKNILINNYNNISLSKEDKAYYDYLDNKFNNNIPRDDEINNIINMTNDNYILNSNIESKKIELNRVEIEVNNLSNLEKDYLSINQMLKSEEKLTETPKNRAYLHFIDIFCELTLAISLYFVLPLWLFLISLVISVLSMGLSAYLLIKGVAKYKESLKIHEDIKLKNFRINNTINNILNKYNYNNLDDMKILYNDYLSKKNRIDVINEELLRLENDYNNNKIAITKFYNNYQVYSQDMFKLKTELNDYKVFTNKLSENKNSRFNLDEDIKNINNTIIDFYNNHNIANSLTLTEIRDIIINLNNNITNYNNILANKNKYISENNVNDINKTNSLDKESVLNSIKALEEEKSRLKLILEEDEREVAKLDDLEYELNNTLDNIKHYKEEYELYTNTIDELTTAYNNICNKYVLPVKDNVKKYLALLNNNLDINLDNNFNLTYRIDGQILDPKHQSRGEYAILSLAYTLALYESLSDSLGFVILDDPFVSLDETNMGYVRGVINKLINNKQVIYLTCHNSRSIKE